MILVAGQTGGGLQGAAAHIQGTTWLGSSVPGGQSVLIPAHTITGVQRLTATDGAKQSIADYIGDRSFASAAPRLWNTLPGDIRAFITLSTCRKTLNIFLFSLAFKLWINILIAGLLFYCFTIFLVLLVTTLNIFLICAPLNCRQARSAAS